MRRIALVVAILLACLLPAGVAQAQFGAPSAPQELTQPPPAPPQKANDLDDGGLSTLQIVLIIGGAVAVLALIAFVIVRDARRAAPVDDHPRRDGGTRGGGSGGAPKNASLSEIRARERQQAKRQKAKAKQVREQRKRNRPR